MVFGECTVESNKATEQYEDEEYDEVQVRTSDVGDDGI